MKKILIRILNNTLIFKEKKKLSVEYKSLLNTNFISCDELLFSDEYILNNTVLVANFIKEIVKSNHIDTVIVEQDSITSIVLDVLKKVKIIDNLVLKENVPLTYVNCEKIIASGIKSVSLYTLQPFMLEMLDKERIIVESRSEILFRTKFMLDNNLNFYSSLFYKVTINLDLPFSLEDEEDFESFCKINKYLKTIHVNKVSKADLESIVDILKKHSKKNVKVLIHDNINDLETIEYLKMFNKKYSKRYKIFFKLIYSDKYLRDNFLKQTNISILKSCGLIIIFIVTMTFGYVFYDNYSSMKKVNDIQEEIKKVIEITDPNPIIAELIEDDEEIIEPEPNVDNPTQKPQKPKESIYTKVKNTDIATLLTINPDVMGWITVPGTNIDYPLVQTTDNDFYLTHNIYSKEDFNGWVFADYRNSKKEVNDNLILYAHNRYYSGVMFGTLQNTTRSSWYNNKNNHILTYKSLYGTYKYKVFSIYKIQKTTDYLVTIFPNDDSKLEFYNMLKNRSIYDFGVNLNGDDKIITLSTCKDKDFRIVLHAVLQKEA